MARTLTKKQRGFVEDYIETGNGVRAAMNNYDTEDYNTANVIAVENLQKPTIRKELDNAGFTSENAKKVVQEILNKEYAEDRDRLKAADLIFKVMGDFTSEKTNPLNEIKLPSDKIIQLALMINNAYKNGLHEGRITSSNGIVSSIVDTTKSDKE